MSSAWSRPGTALGTPPNFLIDRSLGLGFAARMRACGWTVTLINDVFPKDAQEVTDEDWIRYGCAQGWAALTKGPKDSAEPSVWSCHSSDLRPIGREAVPATRRTTTKSHDQQPARPGRRRPPRSARAAETSKNHNAGEAFRGSQSPKPSADRGRLVRGSAWHFVRCRGYDIR
jgi:hypothetical protein